jgi:hypothetical protein
MSISAGEAVRFLPIVMNPYHVETVKGLKLPKGVSTTTITGKSGCYISDLWAPLCYPIRGEYNDYGTIENIPEKTDKDKAELAQFVDAFKEHCLPIELGENEYHDVAVKKFSVDEILGALQEGRCFKLYQSSLPGYADRLLPIAWMMIKESVWQSLLKIDIKKSKEVWHTKGEKDRYSLKGIREGLLESFERINKRNKVDKLLEKKENLEGDELRKAASEILELMKDSHSFMNMTRSRTWHNSPITEPVINENLIDVVTEMEYVYGMMSILRINFAPTTGSGSQCNNYALWSLVNSSWKKLVSKDLKEEREETKKSNAEYKEFLKKEAEKKKKKV